MLVVDGVVALGVQSVQHLEEEGVRDDGEDMVSLHTGICHLLQSELDLVPAKPDASVDDGERWQLEVVDGRE